MESNLIFPLNLEWELSFKTADMNIRVKTSFIILLAFIFSMKNYSQTVKDSTIKIPMNTIELIPTDLHYLRLSAAYYRSLNTYFTLRFPVQINLLKNRYKNQDILNSLATQLFYSPIPTSRFPYLVGLSLKFGNKTLNDFSRNLPSSTEERSSIFQIEVLQGVKFHLGNHFNISSLIGMGYVKVFGYKAFDFRFTFSYGMGFTF
jgi:hypothetical protein